MILFLVNVTAFFLFVLVGSLAMCGWYKATREKMLLEKWSAYWEQKDSNDKYKKGKIVHALSSCVYCYASIYGSLIYWLVGYCLIRMADVRIYFSWHLLVIWITYCLCTCAANGIIIKKVL